MAKTRFTCDLEPTLYNWLIDYTKSKGISRNAGIEKALLLLKSKEELKMNVPEILVDQNVTIVSKWMEENLPHVHDNILDHARMYARDESDSFTEEQYEAWKNDGYLVQFIFSEDDIDITPYGLDDTPAHNAWWLDQYSNWPEDDLELLFKKAKELI